MIKRAGVAAGSVIVLSDGADYKQRDHPQRARRTTPRRRTCACSASGCASRAFDPTSLQALPTTGGSYVEAAQPEDLSGIYSRLADRQAASSSCRTARASRWSPTSPSPFSVTGIGDVVTAAYRAPDFPVPPALPDPPPTWWESGAATTAAVVLIGLLLALGLWMLLRPLRGSMSRRISRFTGDTTTSAEEAATRRSASSSRPRTGGSPSGARGSSSSSTSSCRRSSGHRAGSSLATFIADDARRGRACSSAVPVLGADRPRRRPVRGADP